MQQELSAPQYRDTVFLATLSNLLPECLGLVKVNFLNVGRNACSSILVCLLVYNNRGMISVMKIQISDAMKNALHARCGQKYTVQERGEIEIFVSSSDMCIVSGGSHIELTFA